MEMEQESGLALPHSLIVPHDTLRYGLPSYKSEAIPPHQAQIVQENLKKSHTMTKRMLLEKAYGSSFPMQMDIEKQILSRFQRPPGLVPSSMLGLESLTGALDEFGFEDYLNDPKESESFTPVDIHHGMEVRLGLSKGPASRSFF